MTSYTLTGWIKLTTIAGTSKPYLIGISDNGAGPCLGDSGNCIGIRLDGPSSPSNELQCNTTAFVVWGTVSNTRLQPGNWYNVTCTVNSGTLALYINGVKESSVLSNVGALVWLQNDKITLWNDPSAGLLDDVAVYTHSLSDAQVKELYALGAAKHGLAAK